MSYPGLAFHAQHGQGLLPGMPASSTSQLHVVLMLPLYAGHGRMQHNFTEHLSIYRSYLAQGLLVIDKG